MLTNTFIDGTVHLKWTKEDRVGIHSMRKPRKEVPYLFVRNRLVRTWDI